MFSIIKSWYNYMDREEELTLLFSSGKREDCKKWLSENESELKPGEYTYYIAETLIFG